MLFYILVGVITLVLLLLVVGYHPLPPGLEDRTRAMILMGLAKIFRVIPYAVMEKLGYGTFFDHIVSIQAMSDRDIDKHPRSAWLGVLEVSRDLLADRMVVIYRPRDVPDGELLPCLVYIHGGGWCLDNPISCDHLAYNMAILTRKITIGIHYRRSPQDPFPAGFQDCLSVVRHVLKHGETLGIDVNRVGVGGDSAGGNIAAGIALQLCGEKNSKLPPLKYQILLQPIVQGLDFKLPSDLENVKVNPSLSPVVVAGCWSLYLGLDPKQTDKYAAIISGNRHVPPELLRKYSDYFDTQNLPGKFRKARQQEVTKNNKGAHANADVTSYDEEVYAKIKDKITNPLLCPLLAPDLSCLPPTMVIVAEFDTLRDQGLLYAHRLQQAGVKTEVFVGKGFHADIFCSFLPEWTKLNSKSGQVAVESARPFMQREQ